MCGANLFGSDDYTKNETRMDRACGTGLPPSIGQFTNLQVIDLVPSIGSDKIMNGTLPTEIGNLSNLVWLGLNHNAFGGTLPTELGLLTNLKHLDLTRNQFQGTLPSELGLLTSLTALSVSTNFIDGTIPTSIGTLTALQKRHLNKNVLSGSIPAALGQLTTLRVLGLSTNNFEGSIPPDLKHLTKLEILGFNSNPALSGEIPSEVSGLAKSNNGSMWALDVEGTNISGTIPDYLCNWDVRFYCSNSLCGCDSCPCSVIAAQIMKRRDDLFN